MKKGVQRKMSSRLALAMSYTDASEHLHIMDSSAEPPLAVDKLHSHPDHQSRDDHGHHVKAEIHEHHHHHQHDQSLLASTSDRVMAVHNLLTELADTHQDESKAAGAGGAEPPRTIIRSNPSHEEFDTLRSDVRLIAANVQRLEGAMVRMSKALEAIVCATPAAPAPGVVDRQVLAAAATTTTAAAAAAAAAKAVGVSTSARLPDWGAKGEPHQAPRQMATASTASSSSSITTEQELLRTRPRLLIDASSKERGENELRGRQFSPSPGAALRSPQLSPVRFSRTQAFTHPNYEQFRALAEAREKQEQRQMGGQ